MQEAEFFKAKAERQAELLAKAELARMEAERERARMEAKFTRTDKGTAMLMNAARLKIELEACRESAWLSWRARCAFTEPASLDLFVDLQERSIAPLIPDLTCEQSSGNPGRSVG